MSAIWDDYGPTPLAVIGACLVLIVGLVGAVWWAWPKDAKGNPLPCTHYQTTTYFQPITIGKVTTLVPEQMQVCDAWASPSPVGPVVEAG